MRRILWPLAGALVLSLALVTVGVAGTAKKTAPKPGGTVVFGAEQEPPCLNLILDGCNNTWTSWIVTNETQPNSYQLQPNFSYKPTLIDGDAIVTKSPFTITYRIKKNAVWSDGVPITGDDFVFTWLTIINPKNIVASVAGYNEILRAKVSGADKKTVKFIFKAPYAGWHDLFNGPGLIPKHALQGANCCAAPTDGFNNTWLDNVNDPHTGKPISGGPYLVTNYTKGQSITLERNPKWWGPHKPYLDKIIFKFVTNTDSEIQAIRGGEVDAIYPQPQLQLAALAGQSGLKIQSNQGTTLEHLEFNVGKGGFQLAKAPWFREAFAYGLDRKALVKQLFQTLNPKLPTLESLLYVNVQKEYQPHFGAYTYNPGKVASIMTKHGCTKGGDGIFTCNGTRASIKFSTTAGNKLRELAQEIMQAQEKNAGIEITIANAPSRILFPALSQNQFELALFAWSGSADPAPWNDIYDCGGPSNYKQYCSKQVTSLLKASNGELDPTKRAALVNQADANMALNVPAIPLYLKPTYFVYKTKLQSMIDNPSNAGPTWNIQDWYLG